MGKRRVVITAAALAGVLLLALTSADFLLRQSKDFLVGRAEQKLGRKISVDRLTVTFWPVGLRASNFAVADDPAFSPEDFLRAKELRIELRLLPLLVGEFRPSRLTLDSPAISLVRDASGKYNFAGRAPNGKDPGNRADGVKKTPAKNPAGAPWFPALKISNGTLRYRDLAGGELTLSLIELEASSFEPERPIAIELAAAVGAAKPNLKFKSLIGPIAGHRDFRDVPLDGVIDAADLDLGRVNKALPRWRKSLPQVLRFDGIYTIKELRFKGPLNNLALKGAVTGTDASFRFE